MGAQKSRGGGGDSLSKRLSCLKRQISFGALLAILNLVFKVLNYTSLCFCHLPYYKNFNNLKLSMFYQSAFV
ncbi:hypothetical protein [Campylobacter rectus]|uniref:hypothetical protein n=1 Tax=Campylobacter rectus TaxID=203 RepID=UPI0028EB8BB3|nr:hypothetical protein [Campylobacter rectus]